MNITVEAENTICIELTRQDMTELDITYEELDYSNIETRRVLWTLLDEAKHTLGREIRLTQKMLIEAVPDDNGGCRIYFSVADEQLPKAGKKQLIKLSGMKTVCQSSDIDNIGSLSQVLHKLGCVSKSELYTDGEKYRLIVSQKVSFSGELGAIIREYCDMCDTSCISYTCEHWKLLASPDAVGVMSALS
ncbi:MAG: adaptor protein MecA [Clostridia bacterium]|nr:adaptor protein MecA [Clostridia bacterium]